MDKMSHMDTKLGKFFQNQVLILYHPRSHDFPPLSQEGGFLVE